jgi:hypothetical protein
MDELKNTHGKYIDDDWAMVTNDVNIFKEILDDITQHQEKQPEQYKG